ncbi:MAG: response regulator [Deltaproteobacteria bacterium]|nr:response regulator [Deltaproteobacteria bacterium]MBW2016500.1 response regulator [Deltaproteobacteria bacterium]MBW2128504.1 response regulator [Deltaproteobacteria bacterium]MBW2303637.1 response regulator [Deltaproteobacteria bacterium]
MRKVRFTILVADRNPHVRDFLRREMTVEGYQVRVAKNGMELLRWIYRHEPLDLLILDLDLPDVSELEILEKLQDRIPTLPVVIHSFVPVYINHPGISSFAAFVEKSGNSIEKLKKIVCELLEKSKYRRIKTLRSNKSVTPGS